MTPVFKRVFFKRIPFYSVLLLMIGTGGLVYVFESCCIGRQQQTAQPVGAACATEFSILRLPGVSLVRPLVMADLAEESRVFSPVKQRIQQCVDEAKAAQKVTDVSVYFRRLNDGAWFALNQNQTYNPASLIKVAFLLTFLKEAETNPNLLDRKIHFASRNSASAPNIGEFRLQENQDYTIRLLLNYMIQFSDNDATSLLESRMNHSIFNQVFTDLKIPPPDFSKEYFINASDMGKFFRVLYNGTYLSKEGSQFALELLSRSTFRDGIIAGIGEPMVVAHKFGERMLGNSAQLHEFAIVYSGNEPYLIGIMTTGYDLTTLTEVVRTIARESFQQYRTYLGS